MKRGDAHVHQRGQIVNVDGLVEVGAQPRHGFGHALEARFLTGGVSCAEAWEEARAALAQQAGGVELEGREQAVVFPLNSTAGYNSSSHSEGR